MLAASEPEICQPPWLSRPPDVAAQASVGIDELTGGGLGRVRCPPWLAVRRRGRHLRRGRAERRVAAERHRLAVARVLAIGDEALLDLATLLRGGPGEVPLDAEVPEDGRRRTEAEVVDLEPVRTEREVERLGIRYVEG